MFKCFDGVRPKYTYQNKPCEEAGLKTAKMITDKDALIGSADFSGYKREAKERAALADLSEQGNDERRKAEYTRSWTSQRQDTADECAALLSEKRHILSMQRQNSTAWLHERYAVNRKRMQAIDCQGV
ncbi:hypothetical protein HA050_04055 [Iodobacter sp. HSC-16F04]|uniref:DUF4124 domain-containing protein n=1 Tax=Iodobacter violaceini TaxID=3044271 RepID=A0ABX0KP30_9NEIS|nr:hypothetical protein [Iodobacter violacea]NHQ85284.1 hypothetical protein [Iodobacter violacea]